MPKYTKDQLDEYSQGKLEFYNGVIATDKKRYTNIVDHFGKNASIDPGKNEEYYTNEAAQEYRSIVLPDVEGMDDDMIALVSLGVAFNEKNLHGSYTSSTAASLDMVSFNRVFLEDNIAKGDDKRTKGFSPIMPVLRKEAKEALDEYNKGDKQKVKAALKNIAEYIKDDIGSLTFNSNTRGVGHKKGFYKTISKFMDDPDLGVKEMFNERELARIKANIKKEEAFAKSNIAAKELIENPADANTPEREKQVMDYLMNMSIAAINADSTIKNDLVENDMINSVKDIIDHDANIELIDSEGNVKSSSDLISDLNVSVNQSVNIDYAEKSSKYKSKYNNIITNSSSNVLKNIYMERNISHEEALLSEDDGVKKFTDLYKDTVKDSPIYNSLMNAKTPKEMSKALDNAALRFTAYGTETIPHKTAVSEKAAKLSEGRTAEYKKALTNFRNDLRATIPGAAARTDLDSITAGLNSQPSKFNVFQMNHEDSQSIIDLREKTFEFEKLLYTVPKEPVLANEKVRAALMEAYKASIKYQTEKMKEAKADPNNNKWEPTSKMGKDRFRAAKKIEELAKEFIMDDIMKLENEAAMEENKKLAEEAELRNINKFKELSETKLGEDTIQGKALNSAIEALRKDKEKFPFADRSELVADIMAVKMVSDFYKSAKIKVTAKNANDFKEDVENTSKDLQKRDDFKHMMKSRPLDAETAALEDGGKMLFPMLATAKRNMPKTPKNVQRTTTQPQIKNDLSLK